MLGTTNDKNKQVGALCDRAAGFFLLQIFLLKIGSTLFK